MTTSQVPAPQDDPEDADPGLARERTGLAWTRTSISFLAVGAAILKTDVTAGAIVIAAGLGILGLRRFFPRSRTAADRQARLRLVSATVAVVAAAALAVTLFAHQFRP
jgi:uncharacterized membrane protein YidH (DUF202 family)